MAREKDREPQEPAVGLAQVQDLISQLLAKADPITAVQLRSFTQRPSGPIVPDTCAHSWRVSDEYGDNRDRLDKSPVIDIIGDVNGRCYLLTCDARDLVVVRIDDGYSFRLRDNHDQSLVHRRTRFLGMTSEAIPVILATEKVTADDFQLATPEQIEAQSLTWLCIGEKVKAFRGVRACTWLPGDQFVYEHIPKDSLRSDGNDFRRNVERNKLVQGNLMRFAERVAQTRGRKHAGFWLSSAGMVIAVTEGTHTSRQVITDLCEPDSDNDVWWDVGNAQCQGVVGRHLLVASEREGTYIQERIDGGRFSKRIPQPLPCVEDDAKFTILPDWRFAYVAKLRHGKRAYVADGQLQEGCFDLVSNIVRVNGRSHYYGVAGRHIFLMKVV